MPAICQFPLKVTGAVSAAALAIDSLTALRQPPPRYVLYLPESGASLFAMPGATFTMRLRAVLVPTETVLATFASDPLPIATDRACKATAP